MKKIKTYILGVFLVFAFLACEEEMDVYHESIDRLNFIYEEWSDTLLNRTFVFDDKTRVFDTVWVEVATQGFVVDHDRPFVLEQVMGDTNAAEAGVHFIAFNDSQVSSHYVVPAGANEVKVPIVLKRDASLKDKELTVRFRIGNNENFSSGYPQYQERVITVTDMLVQPKYWNMYATYYFAGKYGKVKHQFMIDVTRDMGIKINDDFFYELVGDPSSVDMGMTDYWFYFFTYALAEENAKRAEQGLDVLREEPTTSNPEGEIVKFTRYEF